MSRPFAYLVVLMASVALVSCAATPSGAGQRAAKSDDVLANVAADMDGELAQAQTLRAQKDYPGAIHILSQLMLVAPDDPRVVSEYGKTLVQQGRYSEALDFLKRAVVLKPDDWTLYSALGVAYDEANDPAAAEKAYRHALDLKPGEAVVLNNFAMSRMLAGDTNGARQLISLAGGSKDPKIVRNAAMIKALPVPAAVASNAPAARRIEPQPVTAHREPRALVSSVSLPPPAQPVRVAPIERKSHPVVRKQRQHPERHELAQAPKLRKTPNADHIPALRLANDNP